jgi:uncharacterized protein with FMN-binding domain
VFLSHFLAFRQKATPMILPRMTNLAIRSWIPAVIVWFVFGARAPAQVASIDGVYNGTYSDAQGPRTLKLSLQKSGNGSLTGVFTLYLPPASHDQAYSYSVVGKFVAASGKFYLRPQKWLSPPPEPYRMEGLAGTFDPGTGQIAGKMSVGKGTFEAARDEAESAEMATAVVPPKATQAASPSPPAGAAPAPSLPAAINGVYAGTYTCVDGTVKLRLSLKSKDDESVTGLFTFDLPVYFGSRSATYRLTGRYVEGNRWPFQFTTVEPLGAPAPAAYAMKGVYASLAGSERISGAVTGTASVSFQATRDETESPNLDSVMAAQARAASEPSAGPPAAPVARLSSINGVYNGTYAGDQGPIKIKLTITQQGHGILAGVLTVYLPGSSGTQAYTYSLQGTNDPMHRHFELSPRDWDTVPPASYEMLGLTATFAPNVVQNTARIFGQMRGTRFWPTFEATWDAAETASITSVIAAQKAVGPPRVPPPTAEEVAAHAALVAAHAAALKNAPPAQLASKDLVRKSKAYWDAYRTDLIREVFDGGFGSDLDDDTQFRILFTSYVQMFSKNCRAYFPGSHESVTIVQPTVTVTDGTGAVVSRREGQTWTVEVDSRFVNSYREYCRSLNSSGQGLVAFVGIVSGNTSPDAYTGPAFDIQRFFATETGPSAAMRQLGENLLRGANGDPSLQDAGAKIAGAEAETDKSLPPGRFLHFVDGANAFYRDPANAKFRTGHDTAFCQLLAEKYRNVMTDEEEYYYANDFGPRFRNQIMQPQKYCTDPEWPRLHPAVEECIAEIK